MNTSILKRLKDQRDSLINQIQNLPPFRPGTIVSSYRKCGKPNCHCAEQQDQGHGPSWSVTRRLGGKTSVKYIPKEQLEETREQIDCWNRFRDIVKDIVEVNVKICDAELEEKKTASREVEKKGSARNCKRARKRR